MKIVPLRETGVTPPEIAEKARAELERLITAGIRAVLFVAEDAGNEGTCQITAVPGLMSVRYGLMNIVSDALMEAGE